MSNSKSAATEGYVVADRGATMSVVCLCAAWCGVCRQYEGEFQGLRVKYPQLRFVWLDVEEREELLGEVDVETFPTLLIGAGDQPKFFGPLLPQVKVLDRLLASLLEDSTASASLSEEAVSLWQRVTSEWQ
jgi:thioredoxin 1